MGKEGERGREGEREGGRGGDGEGGREGEGERGDGIGGRELNFTSVGGGGGAR